MKKPVLVIVSLVAWLGASVVAAPAAQAHSFKSGETVTTQADQPIDQSLFAGGQTISIASEVFGDVFCAGQTVTISGRVHGDVICAAQTLTITGPVDGDVRLAGQTVSLGSTVGGNATIGSQSFVLTGNGRVNGDLTLGSETAQLNGEVVRDVAFGSTTATLSNRIGRNVIGETQQLSLGSQALIGGDLRYTSANTVETATGARVLGATVKSSPRQQPERARSAADTFVWYLTLLTGLLLAAIALAALLGRLLPAVIAQARPRLWLPLLVGFVVTLFTPVALVILAFTVIGLPLALVFGALWFAVLALSWFVSAYYLGQLVMKSGHPLIRTLVGTAGLFVLSVVPLLGFLVVIAAVYLGCGMIVLSIVRPTPSHKSTPAQA